jgi:hypothetical protein
VNDERLRILNLLAAGKIEAREAAELLDALGGPRVAPDPGAATSPRYLRVVVEGHENDHGGKVNVRIPFNLIRAGVKLAALLPPGVNERINEALRQNGLDLDVSKLRPENLEEIVENLGELTVDVEGNRGEKVRVYCE